MRLGDSVDSSRKQQMLFNAKVIEQVRIVRNVRTSLLNLNRVFGDFEVFDIQTAATDGDDASDRLERCCLAGSIASDESEYLSSFDAERQIVHSDCIFV